MDNLGAFSRNHKTCNLYIKIFFFPKYKNAKLKRNKQKIGRIVKERTKKERIKKVREKLEKVERDRKEDIFQTNFRQMTHQKFSQRLQTLKKETNLKNLLLMLLQLSLRKKNITVEPINSTLKTSKTKQCLMS